MNAEERNAEDGIFCLSVPAAAGAGELLQLPGVRGGRDRQKESVLGLSPAFSAFSASKICLQFEDAREAGEWRRRPVDALSNFR